MKLAGPPSHPHTPIYIDTRDRKEYSLLNVTRTVRQRTCTAYTFVVLNDESWSMLMRYDDSWSDYIMIIARARIGPMVSAHRRYREFYSCYFVSIKLYELYRSECNINRSTLRIELITQLRRSILPQE